MKSARIKIPRNQTAGSEAEAIEELDHEVKLWEKAGGYVEQMSADRAYAFEPDGRLVSIIDIVKA
jgi:hypothetical protein